MIENKPIVATRLRTGVMGCFVLLRIEETVNVGIELAEGGVTEAFHELPTKFPFNDTVVSFSAPTRIEKSLIVAAIGPSLS